MQQAPPSPPGVKLRIDWAELIGWEVLIRTLGRVLIIVLVAYFAYRLTKALVRRIVDHEADADDPIVKRLREQRAATLGGLLNNVALIVIVTFASLTILGTFVEIGPLLAGVSVIGLAVSFGAQSLVKDVITGTFILIEGQFGLGDVVRIGTVSGQVEKITLRTTTLRDFEGVVHIIPNGAITTVSNLTKAWSRNVLDIAVAYRENVDHVIALLREIGDEFHADPEWGELLLDEPEVLGLQGFGDSGVIIRMQARTLPLKQWEVGRELRRRIKKRFDQEKIVIAHPHMTFYLSENQDPTLPLPVAAERGLTTTGS